MSGNARPGNCSWNPFNSCKIISTTDSTSWSAVTTEFFLVDWSPSLVCVNISLLSISNESAKDQTKSKHSRFQGWVAHRVPQSFPGAWHSSALHPQHASNMSHVPLQQKQQTPQNEKMKPDFSQTLFSKSFFRTTKQQNRELKFNPRILICSKSVTIEMSIWNSTLWKNFQWRFVFLCLEKILFWVPLVMVSMRWVWDKWSGSEFTWCWKSTCKCEARFFASYCRHHHVWTIKRVYKIGWECSSLPWYEYLWNGGRQGSINLRVSNI